MIVRLPWGRSSITADLRGLRCLPLSPSAPRASLPPAELAGNALDAPGGCPPLVELARGRRRVAVLVPDATRKAWLPEVLPPALERLRRAGVVTPAITVVVACGTHPPAGREALADLLGPLPPGVVVIQHDSRDPSALADAGSLPSGLRIRLNRSVVAADLVVVISAVQHHYFAGFGGGPKIVFPGVAGYQETQANHARVIDLTATPPRRHPGCEPGVLAGNPVAEEIAEAARLRPPDLALLMVAGSDGRPAWAAAGRLELVFPAACARVREWYEVRAGMLPRMVVSAGGYPSDHTLIQAHKALEAACRFLAPGGEALFVAACDGGAGSPDMAPFLSDPRPEAIVARLAERYVQYGHTTLRLVEKTSRFRVLALTTLKEELAVRLGLVPVRDAQEVLDRWREEAPGAVVGVMAGPAVYPA